MMKERVIKWTEIGGDIYTLKEYRFFRERIYTLASGFKGFIVEGTEAECRDELARATRRAAGMRDEPSVYGYKGYAVMEGC